MPWIHFHVGDKGMVKACCVANIPFGNINEKSFNEIWNGDAIETLRSKFARGESDPRCAVCIKREEGGVRSIRQETFEKFPDLGADHNSLPVYFDIRFSNVCNFRCRTCWHGASSRWFQDAQALGRNIGEKAILKNVEDFEAFIRETGEALKGAREIYLAGGEPLVTEAHYLLLEWLIENKVFPKLRYNTNFSVLEFKEWNVLELWKQFPEVEIMASVDESGELGEYIRKEFNWNLFCSNREKIRPFAHIHFKIAPTVSLLNVKSLPQFYLKCIDLGLIPPEGWYINILERPFYYNIKALPQAQKEEIRTIYSTVLKELEERGISKKLRLDFQSCLDFMFAEDLSAHYKAFRKETATLDALRMEDYKKVGGALL